MTQVLGPKIDAKHYAIGDEYKQKLAKWQTTCTKLHSWNLLDLQKVRGVHLVWSVHDAFRPV